jgi:hypothetical protein
MAALVGVLSHQTRTMKLSSTFRTIVFAFVACAPAGGCVAPDEEDALDASETTAEVTQAASYNDVCGSDYGIIDSARIPDGSGTVYLTYNESTDMNCVVTIRDTPGTQVFMDARVALSTSTTWTDDDPGQFTTYAGPSYVYAPHACVNWGGTIGSSSVENYWDHCD